jgi:hypothetical protein
VIFDGPAHAEKGGKTMAQKSDLVLMPTCYGLDDLEAQVEAAYELEENGIDRNRIWFVFSRTSGSPIEDQVGREIPESLTNRLGFGQVCNEPPDTFDGEPFSGGAAGCWWARGCATWPAARASGQSVIGASLRRPRMAPLQAPEFPEASRRHRWIGR